MVGNGINKNFLDINKSERCRIEKDPDRKAVLRRRTPAGLIGKILLGY